MILKNKIALVTGASKGIGKGIALSLGKAGCDIVLVDIDEKFLESVMREITTLGVKALAVKCDVSQKKEVDEMVKKSVETFGKIDILVNNAGIFPFVSFLDMTENDWDNVLDVNLKSIFLCSQAVAKVMPEGGKMINISSIASFVGFAGLSHYCASKGGLNSMIRVLALELADKKITVNAVAPGAIETPGASQGASEESKKQTIAMIPLSRMGQPEDIAGAVTFLASDNANYITGQTIIVDGGWTLK